MGFKEAAIEKKGKLYDELVAIEKKGLIDLARYEKRSERIANLKGLWVLYELESKYGYDFMAKYVDAYRKWRLTNPGQVLNTDGVVELFSSALSKDMKPWFRQIGIRF